MQVNRCILPSSFGPVFLDGFSVARNASSKSDARDLTLFLAGMLFGSLATVKSTTSISGSDFSSVFYCELQSRFS